MRKEKTQVVIVGGGPNGVTLANYMGLYGIDAVVVEVEKQILPYPRAVGMDDEAMRVLQTVDLAEPAIKDMIQNVPLRYYNARGVCFAEVKPAARQYGWPMRNIFMQQLTEATLREGLGRWSNVDLRLGHEMQELTQDENGVTLTVKSGDGDSYQLQADYVIGADGGRSPVRKQLGIKLEGITHPRKWVVVDAANDKLDAPYTALHADPSRPFVCIYLPYQYRRWEFMLFEHEDEEKMCEEGNIRNLIRGHIGDAADELDIVRIRAYTHNSRVAETFVKGRVVLSGDAAHITPPWAGQGLNSGLRDVGNIAWKIAAAAKGLVGSDILQSYDSERRGHATDLIALADNMGAVLGLTDPLMAGVRDWIFKAVDSVDNLREHLVQFKFKPKAMITKGIVHHDSPDIRRDTMVGQLFIQPDVEDCEGRRRKFDEILGPWFSIVGYRENPTDYLSEEHKVFWEQFNTRYIQVNRSRSGLSFDERLENSNSISVEDVDNDLANWFSDAQDRIVVVRPDRFVAAITSPARLNEALDGLRKKLGG
ncbi:bifunctional 3-(3-hydroxy-phenyl)propionate/3-hydroxycinnamic acid hydroxylase [Pseudomaricurvus alkylphenolicus]|uniref:bifunctional 3-(3-hydroxy-phenyl)propionate/3-hydroxycinnamic acid hydroxylase n=1 Tax=Pseudomaricurvus alkylphenolicus TaxID=1306991 RepID=UPI001424171D|nr:bifunctional 3-(3-hydroxy-phenyl)propionate/3-hydroxycinnamic acid hydroxylase [Pseudomaricurvus alkylphenolicus]NIB38289.1 bifunctional 3-(3-hydroxy-phenyl)propionate/3-hydroxycinnamic acid hydroxylase [Pseudomaricurvus alkylphenolicus]